MLIAIFNNKGDEQSCCDYRGMQLLRVWFHAEKEYRCDVCFETVDGEV